MPEGISYIPPEAESFSLERRESASPKERIPYHLSEKDYQRLKSYQEKDSRGELTETEQELFYMLLEVSQTAEGRFRDDLTGLPNRAAWQKEVERERQVERSNEGQTMVFVIDINNFKDFNTQYGHEGGDVVLQHIAQHIGVLVGGSVRGEDVALRYAGDEFCVVARNVAPGGEHEIAERIYDVVAQTPVEIGGQHVSLTISVGHAQVKEDGDLVEAFNRADIALLGIAKAKKGQEGIRTIGYDGEKSAEPKAEEREGEAAPTHNDPNNLPPPLPQPLHPESNEDNPLVR